jgi:hypothetical protein
MSANIRQYITLFFLLMSFLPFLLMTDLFPFMRFAMFAETIKNTPQRETFAVQIVLPNGTSESLSTRQIGLDDSHLNYLARTYFYNQQLDFFTTHLKQSGLVKPKEQLMIVHKTLTGRLWKQDTLLIK